MSESKKLRPEADPLFLVEYMKLTLTDDIYSIMQEESISKTELAKRLGKSRQYVSRILNETANFTLDSIARIAAALQKDAVLRLMNYEDEVVIRPFVEQHKYWFHSTQEYDAVCKKEIVDSLKGSFYKELPPQETFFSDETSFSDSLREGA